MAEQQPEVPSELSDRIELLESALAAADALIQKFPDDHATQQRDYLRDRLAELKKKKIKLSLEEEAEWLTYFNKKKIEANALQAEIEGIEKQIDQMVYELYGLSEEEINVVEAS